MAFERGALVRYDGKLCVVEHVNSSTGDIFLKDARTGVKVMRPVQASELRREPVKDSSPNSRRARLHRALDAVMDRGAARDAGGFGMKVEPGEYEFQRGDPTTASEFVAAAKRKGFSVIVKKVDNRGWQMVTVTKK